MPNASKLLITQVVINAIPMPSFVSQQNIIYNKKMTFTMCSLCFGCDYAYQKYICKVLVLTIGKAL